jgi:tetratricopeptide (TPR) repeat protein
MQMDHPMAGPLLTMAANWSPGVAKVLNNLAANLLHRGLVKEAYALCRRIQREHPNYRKIQRLAAKAALLDGQAEEALEHARRYLHGPVSDEAASKWLEELARLASDPKTARTLRELRD